MADKTMREVLHEEQAKIMGRIREKLRASSDDSRVRSKRRPKPEKINWLGAERELGRKFEDFLAQGQVEAPNKIAIFRQVCEHFVWRGKPINPHSLQENTRQKRDKEKGKVAGGN